MTTTCLYISLQGDDRIAQYTLPPDTGIPQRRADFPLPGMPAPLAADPRRRRLYAGRRLAGAYGLTAFRIAPDNGALTRLNDIPLPGDPVHISADRTGRWLLSAHYYQARVGVHPIGDDGALDSEPTEWRETGIGAHYIQTDPSNRYALVPHIAAGRQTGANAIFQFHFDAAAGRLTPNSPDRAVPPRAEGPRHLCFHPTMDVVYTANEQGSSVTAYRFDPGAGVLAPRQTVTTLPPDYAGPNTCAQIRITPDGRHLYAPNRGHNSIAAFAVSPADGRLTPLGQTPTEPVPRAFAIDPSGQFLYAAGLQSGTLAAYRIAPDTGRLQPLAVTPIGAAPMWILPVVL